MSFQRRKHGQLKHSCQLWLIDTRIFLDGRENYTSFWLQFLKEMKEIHELCNTILFCFAPLESPHHRYTSTVKPQAFQTRNNDKLMVVNIGVLTTAITCSSSLMYNNNWQPIIVHQGHVRCTMMIKYVSKAVSFIPCHHHHPFFTISKLFKKKKREKKGHMLYWCHVFLLPVMWATWWCRKYFPSEITRSQLQSTTY